MIEHKKGCDASLAPRYLTSLIQPTIGARYVAQIGYCAECGGAEEIATDYRNVKEIQKDPFVPLEEIHRKMMMAAPAQEKTKWKWLAYGGSISAALAAAGACLYHFI